MVWTEHMLYCIWIVNLVALEVDDRPFSFVPVQQVDRAPKDGFRIGPGGGAHMGEAVFRVHDLGALHFLPDSALLKASDRRPQSFERIPRRFSSAALDQLPQVGLFKSERAVSMLD